MLLTTRSRDNKVNSTPGEITLSGLVLPVGGIREKMLAARRFGIKTVVIPALNEPDLLELPAQYSVDKS